MVREGLSSVTKGTLFVLIATLLWVLLNFVSRVVVVRSIGSDWNAFSFGLSLAGVLSAFGALGLPSAVARSVPYVTSDDERRTIVRGSLWVGGLSALAISVLLFVFAGPIGQALGSSSVTLGLGFFPIAVGSGIVSSIIASIFQGYEDVTPNALYILIVNPSLFLGFLVFWLVFPPVGITYTEALLAYALANAFTIVLLAIYLVRRLPKKLPPGPQAPSALPRLLRFAAPLFVVGVMASVAGSGDTIILGVFRQGEVGTYVASLTLSRLVPIGVGSAAYIFLPVASRFVRSGDTPSIGTTYATVTKWMTLVSMPLFLLFFFLPGASLAFVYGSGFTSQVLPLQITVAGAFLITLLGPAGTAQVAYGQTRLLATNAVATGLIDVIVALVLVPTTGPYGGYVGAAIAWGVANASYSVLCLVQLDALTGVHPFRWHFVLPCLATGLPIGAVLWAVHPSVPWFLLPVLGVGIALWFVLAVLFTRSVDEGDRLLLEALERLLGRPLPILRRIGRYALRT